MGFGCFMAAPLLYFHYGRFLPSITSRTDLTGTLLKVGVDQTLWAASFLTFMFFTLGKLEGMSAHDSLESVKQKIWPTLIANWKVWPLIQFANFFFIPMAYHLVVVNCASVFWNAYCSYVFHQ